MRSRRLVLGALLAATAALLVACSSSGPPPLGPSYSTPQAWQCVNGKVGEALTLGDTDLTNSGTVPVTIVSVRLPPGARRVVMSEAWLLPDYIDPKNGNDDSMGSGWPYPPAARPNWGKRRLAAGAVIRPGHDLNLVFGLTLTSGRDGYSAGVIVTYTAGGNTYVQQQLLANMVAQDCFAEPNRWN